MLLLLLAACDGDPACDTGPVALADTHNYGFVGVLDIASVDTTAAADLRIDWSAVTSDLQGHAMDPAVDIDLVTVVAFPDLTEEGVEAAVADDELLQSDLGGYAFVSFSEDGATSIQLSELTLLGNDIDIEGYATEGSATWMLLFASGDTPGVGTRMLQFLHPLDASPNTDVVVTSSSTVLDLDVDLGTLTPLTVPTGQAFVVDWSGLSVDGRGNAFDPLAVDTVMVGWFADRAFTDLEGTFLDVALDADALWTAEGVEGTELDLGTLAGDDGAFGGLGADGTYVLALSCSTCSNPAPLVFTQLVGCP